MQRRSFIGAILAASAAPAIVRADSLMKIAAPIRFIGWAADAPYQIEAIATVRPIVVLNFDEYVIRQMRAIADAVGLSYKQLGIDLQHVRYSTACVAGHNAD